MISRPEPSLLRPALSPSRYCANLAVERDGTCERCRSDRTKGVLRNDESLAVLGSFISTSSGSEVARVDDSDLDGFVDVKSGRSCRIDL